MTPSLPLRSLLALCAAGALSLPVHAENAGFDEAMQSYERNHWPAAFAALSRLADAGDAEAARVATLMWRHGPSLYGMTFQLAAGQAERWQSVRTAAAGAHAKK